MISSMAIGSPRSTARNRGLLQRAWDFGGQAFANPHQARRTSWTRSGSAPLLPLPLAHRKPITFENRSG